MRNIHVNLDMENFPDFIAELKYLSAENGGRKTAAKTGYRPQIKFGFTEKQTSGIQNFIGKDSVLPGEIVRAEIKVLSPHFFQNQLEIGMEFNFNEGAKIIGTGRVLEVVNQMLKRASL